AKELAEAADMKAKRAGDDLNNMKTANQYLTSSIVLSYTGQYLDAVKGFDSVIQYLPDYPDVYAWKAYALKRLKKFDDAVDVLQHAIQLNLNNEVNPNWLYNLSCYKALAGYPIGEVIKDIKALMNIDHPKAKALSAGVKDEADFSSIINSGEFKQCLHEIELFLKE
ncbi:MAG: hypothetical protein ACRESZ_19790, partial [Methylococcales bacterium]